MKNITNRDATSCVLISEADIRSIVRDLLLLETATAAAKAGMAARAWQKTKAAGKFTGRNWKAITSPTGQLIASLIRMNPTAARLYLGDRAGRAVTFIRNINKKNFDDALGGAPGVQAWRDGGVIVNRNAADAGYIVEGEVAGSIIPMDSWEFVQVGNKRLPLPQKDYVVYARNADGSKGDILLNGDMTVKQWGEAFEVDPLDIKFPNTDDLGQSLLRSVAKMPDGVLRKYMAPGLVGAAGLSLDAWLWIVIFDQHPLGLIINQLADIFGVDGAFAASANLETMFDTTLSNKLTKLQIELTKNIEDLSVCVAGGTYYYTKDDQKPYKPVMDIRRQVMAGMFLLAQVSEEERNWSIKLAGQAKELIGNVYKGQKVIIPEAVMRDIYDGMYYHKEMSEKLIAEKTAEIWKNLAEYMQGSSPIVRLADFSNIFGLLSGQGGVKMADGSVARLDGTVKEAVRDYLNILPTDKIARGFLTDPGLQNVPVLALGTFIYDKAKAGLVEYEGEAEAFTADIVKLEEAAQEALELAGENQKIIKEAIKSIEDSLSSMQTAVFWENTDTQPTPNYQTDLDVGIIEKLIEKEYGTSDEFIKAWEEELDNSIIPDVSTDGESVIGNIADAVDQVVGDVTGREEEYDNMIYGIVMSRSVGVDLRPYLGKFGKVDEPRIINENLKDVLVRGGEASGYEFLSFNDIISGNYNAKYTTDPDFKAFFFTIALIGAITRADNWNKASLGLAITRDGNGRPHLAGLDRAAIADKSKKAVKAAFERTQ